MSIVCPLFVYRMGRGACGPASWGIYGHGSGALTAIALTRLGRNSALDLADMRRLACHAYPSGSRRRRSGDCLGVPIHARCTRDLRARQRSDERGRSDVTHVRATQTRTGAGSYGEAGRCGRPRHGGKPPRAKPATTGHHGRGRPPRAKPATTGHDGRGRRPCGHTAATDEGAPLARESEEARPLRCDRASVGCRVTCWPDAPVRLPGAPPGRGTASS